MGKIFKAYLGGGVIYRCSGCRSHLALHDELVSKAFQGRHGRAYLFGNVINVTLGPKEDRVLTTGLHTVCDIFCTTCEENIGWFYGENHGPLTAPSWHSWKHAEEAFEESQKYKEGKFILEKEKLIKEALA